MSRRHVSTLIIEEWIGGNEQCFDGVGDKRLDYVPDMSRCRRRVNIPRYEVQGRIGYRL